MVLWVPYEAGVMSAEKVDIVTAKDEGEREVAAPRAPYEPPRIEKRRSVARVTLLSGMGQMGVGVAGMAR